MGINVVMNEVVRHLTNLSTMTHQSHQAGFSLKQITYIHTLKVITNCRRKNKFIFKKINQEDFLSP